MRALVLLLICSSMFAKSRYTVSREVVEGIESVTLQDEVSHQTVKIVPSLGNNSYSYQVNGQEIFWSPYKTLKEFQAKPANLGNPFLAPWANRIDGLTYFANGKKYQLNPELGNLRLDGAKQPIHGLLMYAPWKVTRVEADAKAAWVTSRLEFWREPAWMAQFPFAHNLEMTYRLSNGELEVLTTVENLSAQPLPLSLGYHPYFQINDAPRDEWQVNLPVQRKVLLSGTLTPTGETGPADFTGPLGLRGVALDDVFTDLQMGAHGRTEFWVMGKKQKVSVIYGRNYPVAVVYAPPGRSFICFEPMTGVTNAFNLGHLGKFPLQSVPAGGSWRESYWIRPSGY
ncbi:MAG: aldose 1-epimerase [Bryobacteraceae bacterium]|nr:aldose 1-epimerase [Bryobacteraceae bacterium]